MFEIATQEIETSPELSVRPRLELVQDTLQTPLAPEAITMSREDCMLADVDDLARFRTAEGSYEQGTLDSVLQNKVTAVKEGAMPYARSEVTHSWIESPEGEKGGVIMDLGRTAVQTAMRGRLFYKYEESLERCDVEVDYAKHNQDNLRPGIAHVMIAPKMTRKDASLEVAKKEGLADTDSIQINWLDLDENGQPQEAKTESILAADVPIEAWIDMLADGDNNIFKKAIKAKDPQSALSVMETYAELEIPVEKLGEGPVSILAAVLPYIKDSEAYAKVASHIEEFRGDQQAMDEKAQSPAQRWLDFDIATEQSIQAGYANDELKRFINSLGERWGEEDIAVINSQKIIQDGEVNYVMTRELASVLQNAQRNMILTSAAVITGNKAVLKQVNAEVATQIYDNEMAIQEAHRAGVDMIMGKINGLIASQNIKVGGGCSGTNEANFHAVGEFNGEIYDPSKPVEEDQYGSLTFSCQSGHSNRRSRGKLIDKCTTCHKSVKC